MLSRKVSLPIDVSDILRIDSPSVENLKYPASPGDKLS